MDPIILSVAFALGYLVFRLGLPPLVGFLLAGLVLNLFGYTSTPALEALAEIGVTLLLFSIGLKLNIKSLLKPEVLGGATIHMALSVTVLGFFLFILSQSGLQFFLGIELKTALIIAFGLSFSSTVFAVKVLENSGRMDSLNGRVAIGVLVIQDIIAVVYLTVSTGKIPSYWALAVIALLPVARKIFMLIMDRVGHGELQVLFGLFLALAAGGAVFNMVGLKADLGALILGILVAPHARAKETANSLLNIKDLLLVGFFLDIGLAGFPDKAGLVAAIILVAILPLKVFLYFVLFTKFKLKARTSFTTMVNLANYSEFGLIVCSMAVASGNLDKQWLVVMAIALSLSLILASVFSRYEDAVFSRFESFFKKFETSKRLHEEQPFEPGYWQVFIIGMGRIGVGAYDVFREKFGDVVVGVDYDPVTVAEQTSLNRKVVLGDVTDPDFWGRLPNSAPPAKLVILATPCLEAKLYVMKTLKSRGYTGSVAAVTQFDDEIQTLLDAGVDTAFNMYAEAGAGLATHVCAQLSCHKES